MEGWKDGLCSRSQREVLEIMRMDSKKRHGGANGTKIGATKEL